MAEGKTDEELETMIRKSPIKHFKEITNTLFCPNN